MNSNPVVWFEIQVQQLERAKSFYEKVFEIRLENIGDSNMPYWTFPAEMQNNGAGGALTQAEGSLSGPGGTLVYFACADCAVEGARAAAAGGSLHTAKMQIGEYGFICLVHDTEGNLIGLHSMQ